MLCFKIIAFFLRFYNWHYAVCVQVTQTPWTVKNDSWNLILQPLKTAEPGKGLTSQLWIFMACLHSLFCYDYGHVAMQAKSHFEKWKTSLDNNDVETKKKKKNAGKNFSTKDCVIKFIVLQLLRFDRLEMRGSACILCIFLNHYCEQSEAFTMCCKFTAQLNSEWHSILLIDSNMLNIS